MLAQALRKNQASSASPGRGRASPNRRSGRFGGRASPTPGGGRHGNNTDAGGGPKTETPGVTSDNQKATMFWFGVRNFLQATEPTVATAKPTENVAGPVTRAERLPPIPKPSNPAFDEEPGGIQDGSAADTKAAAVKGDKLCTRLSQALLIPPNPAWKMKWDLLVGAFVLYSIMSVPLRLGFDVEVENWSTAFFIDLIVDISFGIDMVFCFNQAFIEESAVGEAVVVADRGRIAKSYLTSWFGIDFFSTFPFDRIQFASSSNSNDVRVVKLIRVLRLVRLLKLARIFKLSKLMQNIDLDDINPAVFSLTTLVIKTVFVAHLLSCFFFFITSETFVSKGAFEACKTDDEQCTWVTVYGGDDVDYDFRKESLSMKYTTTFYWAIATMLAVGYGDIHAWNSRERLYTIVAQLLGSIVFGTVIGTVSLLVESRDPQARARKSKLDQLKIYLKERNIPRPLQKRAKEAMIYFLEQRSVFNEMDALMHLPTRTYNALVLEMYSATINKINILKTLEPSFAAQIAKFLRPMALITDETIAEEADLADEISFLTRGTVLFTMQRGGHQVITGSCTEGNYLGEFAYFRRTARLFTATAASLVNYSAISKDNLEEVLLGFPDIEERITKEFAERAASVMKVVSPENKTLRTRRGWESEMQFQDGVVVRALAEPSEPVESKTDEVAAQPSAAATGRLIITRHRSPTKGVEFVEETSSQMWDRLKVVDPSSPNKIKWDVFVGVLILYSVIVIPFRIGFEAESRGAMKGIDYCVDMIFGLDIVVAFRTCYLDATDDALVTDLDDIARNYFKSWFSIDFFSCFPIAEIIGLILGGGGSSSNLKSMKLMKVIRLFRLLKLIRLLKLGKYMEQIEETLGVQPAVFDLLTLFAQVTFVAHFFACFFHLVGLEAKSAHGTCWFDDKSKFPAQTNEEKYIGALYWAFTTMTTVGYGDITPVWQSTEEKSYAIVMMMFGATVFAFILANVANLIESLRGSSVKAREHLRLIMEYMDEKNIPPSLRMGVRKHWQYVLHSTLGMEAAEHAILERIPLALARQIIMTAHADIISRIPLFGHIPQIGITQKIFHHLSPAAFPSGYTIFEEGDLAGDIHFITKGTVDLSQTFNLDATNRIEQLVVAKATSGNMIGQEGLMQNGRHPWTAVATSLTQAYFINNHSIVALMYDSPFAAVRLQMALGRVMSAQRLQYEQNSSRLRRARLLQHCNEMSPDIPEVKLNQRFRSSLPNLLGRPSHARVGNEETARKVKLEKIFDEIPNCEGTIAACQFGLWRSHSCPDMRQGTSMIPPKSMGLEKVGRNPSLDSAFGMGAEQTALQGQLDPRPTVFRSRTVSFAAR